MNFSATAAGGPFPGHQALEEYHLAPLETCGDFSTQKEDHEGIVDPDDDHEKRLEGPKARP